jgi:hypothetical protein
MRGTNAGSRYAMPFRIEPDLGQRPENSVQPPSKQRCHVLQHNDSRSEFANQANGLEKQSGAFSVKSCPESGVGNILAGEPAADDIDSLKIVGPGFSDISLPVNLWPMFGKHSVCIVVNLHLPLADHSSPLKTKVKPTDSGEQTSECDGFRIHNNSNVFAPSGCNYRVYFSGTLPLLMIVFLPASYTSPINWLVFAI